MTDAAAPHWATTVETHETEDDAASGGGPPGPNRWIELLHETAGGSLGIDVIYDALALVAERFGLEDLTVAVTNDGAGVQAFRLHRRPIGPSELERITDGSTFIATPDSVPAGAQRLVTGIIEVALATQLAQRRLIRDPLTGLLSRQVLNEALRAAAAQSSRYGWTFTLMVLRIGAAVTERDIRSLGHAFGRALRSGDTGTRLHRATFLALLPNATAESLHALVQRFAEESGRPLGEVRFASATAPNDSVDPAELFRLAASRLNGD